MFKRSYDNGIDWLIGTGRERGNLHNLEGKELFKIFDESWKQKYKPKDFVTHIINYKNNRNSNSYKPELPHSVYQDKNKVIASQTRHWIKPLMKNYCSCILAFGLINYLNCCELWMLQPNLFYFHENVTTRGADWLPKSCVTDEEFNAIYAFFQADIKETRKVDWKDALTDALHTFDLAFGIASGNKQFQVICPLHDDTEASLSINIEDQAWTCHGGCGAGYFHTFIARVKGQYWHEIKANYLTDEIKLVNPNPPQSISEEPEGKKLKLIDTEPLNESHPLVTEYGFDLEYLNSWGVKTALKQISSTPEFDIGNYAMPYIVDGKVKAYAVRFSPEEAKREERRFDITKGFKRSKHLLGIHWIEDNPNLLILVEGGKDAMRLGSFGYNSVATFTSGMSEHQLELIKEINPIEICVALDNDNAGRNARVKAISDLKAANLNVSLINLNEYKDFGDIKDKDIVDKYVTSRILM